MADPLRTVQISEKNNHLTHISSPLTLGEAHSIEEVLQKNHDVFA